MRYTVMLEQEEDGGYVASVPALPGCVSQGDSRGEALANVLKAIKLYLDDCIDAGEPVPMEAGKEFVEVEATEVVPESWTSSQERVSPLKRPDGQGLQMANVRKSTGLISRPR